MVTINEYLCKGCEYCITFCPKNVLELSSERNKRGHFFPKMKDESSCISCGICALMCPEGAIELTKKEAE